MCVTERPAFRVPDDERTSEPRYVGPVERHVTARLEATVTGEADVVLAIAVDGRHERTAEELTVRLDREPLEPTLLSTGTGGRLHLLSGIAPGQLNVDYTATVLGSASPQTVTAMDRWYFARPSRYCQSDQLGPTARSEFAGLSGRALLDAISSWVGSNVTYLPGSSRPTDGAVTTLLSRAGVCRDFAHLAAALLRANGVPARITSVYAPGLDPMDFHAVAEAEIDGMWVVVDPTTLAPRPSLVRIATGIDATDTAFLTTLRGTLDLDQLVVTAVVEPGLPSDDLTDLVALT